nr:zinc finger, CCHC-type [Tanacetum cinerariifolium]
MKITNLYIVVLLLIRLLYSPFDVFTSVKCIKALGSDANVQNLLRREKFPPIHPSTEEEDTHEPLTYQEAVACEDSSKWKAAMKEEMDSRSKNKTWELVDHQAGQKEFDMKDLREAKKILGMEIVRDQSRKILRVSQSG